MAFSSGSTLQQTDEVAAVAPSSSGGGGGGGVSDWDDLTGELSGPVPFDATDDDGNPVPRGADFLNTSVEVRWERDPANGVALRVRDVTNGSDLLETNEGGLTDVPALNVQDTLTIPEKGDGAGQYIGDADFQLGTLLARDTATDPDTLDVTLQAGTNITIESDGTINATGGTGSETDILEGGTEIVADATDVDFASDDFDVTNPSGSEAAVTLANDTVTVAGNPVPLGGSTSIGHGDLSTINSDDHHVKTTSASDLSDVSADSVSDAHHPRPSAGDGLSESSSTFSVNENQVDHDSLNQYAANEHVDHSTVSISAGTGLSGGGNITASRTIGIATNGVDTNEIASDAVTGEEIDNNSDVEVGTLNVQQTLTIPEKGDGANQYIGNADFQIGQGLVRDNTTDPDTLKVDDANLGGGEWGEITGTLSNQTDIQNALDSKLDTSNAYTNSDAVSAVESQNTLQFSNVTLNGGGTLRLERDDGNARQRADARATASTDARLHWYGKDSNGGNTAAKHAFYDGSSYVDIRAASGELQIKENDIWHDGNADSKAVSAINNDADHGSTASHNYTTSASGLSDVSPDSDPNAHHAVFEPADYNPVSDVEAHGNALAIDITGDADTLDGVEGGNYARTDVNETFSEEVVIEEETVVNSVSGLTASGNNKNTDWNLDYQHKIIGLNNALTFTVPSDTNNREAAIQAGHRSGGFSDFPGDLYLNPVGGDVVVGGDAGFGGETAPSYAVDVDGRAQATTVEATDTLLIPEK